MASALGLAAVDADAKGSTVGFGALSVESSTAARQSLRLPLAIISLSLSGSGITDRHCCYPNTTACAQSARRDANARVRPGLRRTSAALRANIRVRIGTYQRPPLSLINWTFTAA